jgi:predicted dienelactone hydrolase
MVKMIRFVLALLSLAGVALAGTCPPDATTASFAAPGKFAVAEETLTLVDTSRATPPHASAPGASSRTLKTELWYPTSAAGAHDLAKGGPFPLIVNSPGLLDNRMGEKYYAQALASRGFVVASIDFPLTNTAWIAASSGGPFLGDVQHQPGDVSFVIDRLLDRARDRNDALHRGIDRHRIGVTGLSLGAVTTLLVTYHPTLRDHRVRAALPIAPAGGCGINKRFFATMRPRLLVLVGSEDLILPPDVNAAPAFDLLRSPRTLVTLVDGTHTAFAGFFTDPSATSYDVIGCSILTNLAGWGNPFEGLGGPQNGIESTDVSCERVCQNPVPSNAPMPAARQHELTTAVEAAFFESTFARSRSARCFLASRLASENTDVTVQSAHGRAR